MSKISQFGHSLYSGKVSINFVGRWLLWYCLSGLIVALAVFGLTWRGLNLGIEFEGGTTFTVSDLDSDHAGQKTVDQLRADIGALNIKNADQPVVATSGANGIIIQTEPLSSDEKAAVTKTILDVTDAKPGDISDENLGKSWGRDILNRAMLGLGVFLLVVVLFIWAYFREWKMSVAAIVALAHDIVITVGVYALSGFEVSPATVTGILTILGFSLYDTVVVFDKVRENTRVLAQRHTTYSDAANLAVNQTLVRSINTSLVALLPVGAILYVGAVQLGSGSLKDLALALFVGMAAGAYSSIFIATPLLVQLKANEQDIQLAAKRAATRAARADKYAAVPVFSDAMPMYDESTGRATAAKSTSTPPPSAGASSSPVAPSTSPPPTAPPRGDEAVGSGRVVPEPQRPVKPSGASKRAQPSRESRSKRGRK